MAATEWHRMRVVELARVVQRDGRVREGADLLAMWLDEEWERGYDTGRRDAHRDAGGAP